MDYALTVDGLCKKYPAFELDRISLQIPMGSIMGLVGDNGAGKTTTIKAILNLVRRDAGEIKILGKDNIKEERAAKEQVGVVFDELGFHPNLPAKVISAMMKNIFQNWDEKKFFGYLTQFNLPANQETKKFSRGMRMKLAIAVALSHGARLLILDEATSGLDPIIRSEILDVFLEFIQDENHAILISSHITSDLEKIADYVTFLHEGKTVFSERSDDLRYRYAVIRCGAGDFNQIDPRDVLRYRKNQFGYEVLVKNADRIPAKYPRAVVEPTNIEDIMLFFVRGQVL